MREVKPNTFQWYTKMAQHLEPLGHREATELTAKELNAFLLGLKNAGMSSSVLRGVRVTLRAVLTFGDIHVRTAPLKASTKARRKGTWKASEAARFLQYAQDDRLFAACTLALVGGMRRGELCGLQWKHVNLEDGVVNIDPADGAARRDGVRRRPQGHERACPAR